MEPSVHNGETLAGQRLRSPFPSTPEKKPVGARVLVVDDEQGIRRFLRAALVNQGYEILEASSGQAALQAVPAVHPDVMILDLGLPDLDGIDVTRSLREWTQLPIVVLSVRNQEADKIEALDAGADDYLTKPFGPGELLARLRATLRRVGKPETGPVFSTGELEVDLSLRSVRLAGNKVQLTPTEYDLLKTLIRYTGKLITHRQVIREVWGGTCYEDDMHLLRVNVSNLRRKLEQNPARPRYIVTEPGIGYRLRTDEWS
jgi:two-component system KDP operon response regulator KdpE